MYEISLYSVFIIHLELFAQTVAQAQSDLSQAVGEAVYLIDSIGTWFSGLARQWARFSAKTVAPGPTWAMMPMLIEAGATFVFNLGYHDYG